MPTNTILLAIIIAVVAYVIITSFRKKPSVKIMLLGLQISLVGGILVLDHRSSLMGVEYALVFGGAVLALIGFIEN